MAKSISKKRTAPRSAASQRALVIGVSDYPNPADRLPAVAADLREMAKLLSSKHGTFSSAGVTVLANKQATRGNVMAALRSVFTNAGADVTIFVYLAGHGDVAGSDYYFIAYDTDGNRLDEMGQNEQNAVYVLRDSLIEQAVFQLVSNYLGFCKSVGVAAPIWMFSALVKSEGVRICTNWGFRDASSHGIDRSPCYLPEIEITSLDVDPKIFLRAWCDTLWQACGMERSFNFDQDGNWRERQR